MSRDLLAHLFRSGERRPRHKLVVHHRDDVHKTKGGEPTVARKQWTFSKGYKRRKPTAKASGGQKQFKIVRKGEKPRPRDPDAKTFKIVRAGADPERQARLERDLRKSRDEPRVQRLDAARVEATSGWASTWFEDQEPLTVSLGYEVDEEERKRDEEDFIRRETVKRLRNR